MAETGRRKPTKNTPQRTASNNRNVRTSVSSASRNMTSNRSATSNKNLTANRIASSSRNTSSRVSSNGGTSSRSAMQIHQNNQAVQGGAVVRTAKKPVIRTKRNLWEWLAHVIDLSPFDFPLFTITLVLLAFGVVMMFSASYATAYSNFNDSFYYVKRQLIFAGSGIVIMLVVSALDYHIFKTKFLLRFMQVVVIVGMISVKLFGMAEKGAERRFEVFGISVQPSEVLKMVIIITMAYMIEKNYDKITDLKGSFIPMTIPLVLSCGLLLIQPHLSATIIVAVICVLMMFVGGCRLKHLIPMILLGIVLVILALLVLQQLGYDYYSDRVQSFVDPESDIKDKTFQTYQSLVTIGSGGMFGLGLGNSRQKYQYLPESQNDFVFSIICEELGFVGAILIILLFLLFVIRGFYIASRAKDKFGMLVAVGISVHLGLQALMNIAVVSNAMPNTGISLPFFSYGGSALLMQLVEVGVLLSISRKSVLE